MELKKISNPSVGCEQLVWFLFTKDTEDTKACSVSSCYYCLVVLFSFGDGEKPNQPKSNAVVLCQYAMLIADSRSIYVVQVRQVDANVYENVKFV
jgi:hypothetical protein